MSGSKSYFFCGIGGSGMLPLASIVRARGAEVAGSDRALDQGRTAAKFDYLRGLGIGLHPQDGSGLVSPEQILVASAAVEDSVPDVQAARRLGLERVTRAELLARLFNAADTGIAVGGTSGKSTVTGMIAWILHRAGLEPTVMNGAVMKNFATAEAPFASALVGGDRFFVSEVDESDGSIALFRPKIAVLNNVSLDHKSMDELRALFGDFLATAQTAVLNLDDPETRALAEALPPERRFTFSFSDPSADLHSPGIDNMGGVVRFAVRGRPGEDHQMASLPLWGSHNARNALAALAATVAAGVPLAAGVESLAGFKGLRRRFEEVGERNGVLVIDDFGHNPDKIAATLQAARSYLQGRLLLFFQPHGYGPLRTMRSELVAAFAEGMEGDDLLILCDPVYFGGTVERTVTSADIVADVGGRGRTAEHIPDRAGAGRRLAVLARPGDRII
ncbi:MAG TPA: Mur ligase family protein, partial [Allosphingosinicella sp.]